MLLLVMTALCAHGARALRLSLSHSAAFCRNSRFRGRRNVFRVTICLCRNSWPKRRRNVHMSQGTEAVTSHTATSCTIRTRHEVLNSYDKRTATVFVRRVSSLYTQLRHYLSTRVRKWSPRHEQLERVLFWK